MKRTLVSYGGDSSASENESETSSRPNKRPNPSSSSSPQPPPPGTKQQQKQQQQQQQRRKRKLPALPAHLAPSVPPDDPSKHQGRTRTTPHVDGQWAAYVYVPVKLRGGGGSATAPLKRVVERAVGIAKMTEGETGIVPVHTRTVGSCSESGSGDDKAAVYDELHVSLTRPFFLRAYQREEMKRAVRDIAKAHPP